MGFADENLSALFVFFLANLQNNEGADEVTKTYLDLLKENLFSIDLKAYLNDLDAQATEVLQCAAKNLFIAKRMKLE